MRYSKVTYNIINNNKYLTCCRRGENSYLTFGTK